MGFPDSPYGVSLSALLKLTLSVGAGVGEVLEMVKGKCWRSVGGDRRKCWRLFEYAQAWGCVVAQCDAVTKRGKGVRCVNGDAVTVVIDGVTAWRCHLHNPNGLYRLQVAARLVERRAARTGTAPRTQKPAP